MKGMYMKLVFMSLGLILLGALGYNVYWMALMSDVPANVKPALKTVLQAYHLSRITGDYWEDEIHRQSRKIAALPQSERVVFFRGILLTACDLRDSRGIAFVEALGDDAAELRANLIRLNHSPPFSRLSKRQQQETIAWIDELEIVSQQRILDKEYDSRKLGK
jgi:hypothetical protein